MDLKVDIGSNVAKFYSAVRESSYEEVRKLMNSLKLSPKERFEWFCHASVDNQKEIADTVLHNGFEYKNPRHSESGTPALKAKDEIVQLLMQGAEAKTVDFLAPFELKYSDRRHSQTKDSGLKTNLIQDAAVKTDDVSAAFGFEHSNRCSAQIGKTALKAEDETVELLMQEAVVKTDDFFASFGLEHSNKYGSHIGKAVLRAKDKTAQWSMQQETVIRTDGSSESFGLEHSNQCCAQIGKTALKAEDGTVKLLMEEAVVKTDDFSASLGFEHSDQCFSQIENVAFRAQDKTVQLLMQEAAVKTGDFPASFGFEHNDRCCCPVENAALKAKDQTAPLLTQDAAVKTDDFTASFFVDLSVSNCDQTDTLLLSHGIDICCKMKGKLAVIKMAVAQSSKIIELRVLAKKANVNSTCEGSTPLHDAVETADVKTVAFLLKHGAFLDAENSAGVTPLLIAVQRGFVPIVELLIEAGADINSRVVCATDKDPLRRKLIQYQEREFGFCVDFLGGPPGPKKDWTLLHVAATKGLDGVVSLLLRKGAQVDTHDSVYRTPLYLAALQGHENVVKLLLSYGADVDYVDANQQTPLHYFAAGGCVGSADLVLRNGASVDSANVHGQTPLHVAVALDCTEVVGLLLQYGARIDAKDSEGMTPLMVAASAGHTEVAKLLLESVVPAESTAERLLLNREAIVNYEGSENMTNASEGRVKAPVLLQESTAGEEIEVELLSYCSENAVDSESAVISRKTASTGHLKASEGQLESTVSEELKEEKLLPKCRIKLNALGSKRAKSFKKNVSTGDSEATKRFVESGLSEELKKERLMPQINAKDLESSFVRALIAGHTEASKYQLESTVSEELKDEKLQPKNTANVGAEDLESTKVFKRTTSTGQVKAAKRHLEDTISKEFKVKRLLPESEAKDSESWTTLKASSLNHFKVLPLLPGKELLNYHVRDDATRPLAESKAQEGSLSSNLRNDTTKSLQESKSRNRDDAARLLLKSLASEGLVHNNLNEVLQESMASEKLNKCRMINTTKSLLETTARKGSTNKNLGKDIAGPLPKSTQSENLTQGRMIDKVSKFSVETTVREGLMNKNSKDNITTPLEELTNCGDNEATGSTLKVTARDGSVNNNRRERTTKRRESTDGRKPLSYRTKHRQSADIDCFNNRGMSALYLAAMRGHTKIVTALLASGANVNLTDGHGDTALRIAVEGNHADVVEILLEHGADTELEYRNCTTALLTAVLAQIAGYKKSSARQPRIVKALLEHGADIESLGVPGGKTFSSLLLPIKYDPGALRTALEYGYVSENTVRGVLQTVNDYDLHDNRNVRVDDVSASEVLVRHVVKMQVLGAYCSTESPFTEDFNDQSVIRRFRTECAEELARMRCAQVGDSCVTFYDLLVRSANRLARISNNEEIVQTVRGHILRYPVYGGVVLNRLEKGEARRRLVEKGCEVCRTLFGRVREVPYEIVELVLFRHFANRDLRNLIAAQRELCVEM